VIEEEVKTIIPDKNLPDNIRMSLEVSDDKIYYSMDNEVFIYEIDYEIDYEDSPFGIQAPYSSLGEIPQEKNFLEVNNLISDIGAKWIRMLVPELEKTKEFSHEFNIIAGISSPEYPNNMVQHITKTKKIVSLYKDDVQAWMIINEADLNWKDTDENYAKYVIETSKAIKSVSPDAKIAISFAGLEGEEHGFSATELLDSALENNIGSHFDILDFHFQGSKGKYKEVLNYVSKYNQILSKHGINKKSLWITEYGTYSGDPQEECSQWWVEGPQSEKEHASELIKRYIYGISLNIDKMFWTGITEWNKEYQGFGLCSDAYPYKQYFNYVGLINTPTQADSSSHKKLAYFSYKFMTEKLEGSDWDNVQTFQELDNVYIYKFTKNNEPIWVAWWDYFDDTGTSKTISLDVGNINSAKITEAVPDAEDGSKIDANDYPDFFKTETKTVSGGKVEITLGESPVFVEGK
ncbi:MAG: hypothetical protein KJ646_04140, partial [Nanoarchaeota archaeon]|nr:hypothetical protein [Nanoarchaeota archaeon]